MLQDFLYINADDLAVGERVQLDREGKVVPPEIDAEITALAADEEFLRTSAGQAAAGAILDKTAALPMREDYEFEEPSDPAGIRAARPSAPELPAYEERPGELEAQIYGAWLGRIYGCYLGKPVEGLRRRPGEDFILQEFLQETGQWPLRGYFSLEYPAELLDRHGLRQDWGAGPAYMPEDDDTNYTLVGFGLMKEHGCDFAPENVASFWLEHLAIGRTYTAERVAYRNFCNNIEPPRSAAYRNIYREWIGAQIRGDFFGYACPGDPEKAAAYAWRDACISHVRNGIYGEMWAAAMLAAAYVCDDIETVIRAGLAQIPAKSRLAAALEEVLSWHKEGLPYEAAAAKIHEGWDEQSLYDWCHVIPNAQICALGLLWGEGDYAQAISRAVLPGFDTDCNGATVGSVMGMLVGGEGLPAALVGRLSDRLKSGLRNFADVSIKETAGAMAQTIAEMNRYH